MDDERVLPGLPGWSGAPAASAPHSLSLVPPGLAPGAAFSQSMDYSPCQQSPYPAQLLPGVSPPGNFPWMEPARSSISLPVADISVPSLSAGFPTLDMSTAVSSGGTPVSSVNSGVSPLYRSNSESVALPYLMAGGSPSSTQEASPSSVMYAVPQRSAYLQAHPQYHQPSSYPCMGIDHSTNQYYFSCPTPPYSMGSSHGHVILTHKVPLVSPQPSFVVGAVQPYTILQPVNAAGQPISFVSIPTSEAYQSSLSNITANSVAANYRQGTKLNSFQVQNKQIPPSPSTKKIDLLELSSKEAAEKKKAEFERLGKQAAIDYIRANEQHIEALVQSPFANHLVQFLIKRAPETIGSMIIENIVYNDDVFKKIIKGKYSCWVLQTILESGYTYNEKFERLLIKNAYEFAMSESGNFVLQRALECNQFHLFDLLAKELLKHFQSISNSKQGSHVAESLIRALRSKSLLDEVAIWLFTRHYFFELVVSKHGCFVVEKLAETTTGNVKMCCLRIIKDVINTYNSITEANIPPELDPDQLKSTKETLKSVKLKCKLIEKGFEDLPPLSQDNLPSFLKDSMLEVVEPFDNEPKVPAVSSVNV